MCVLCECRVVAGAEAVATLADVRSILALPCDPCAVVPLATAGRTVVAERLPCALATAGRPLPRFAVAAWGALSLVMRRR